MLHRTYTLLRSFNNFGQYSARCSLIFSGWIFIKLLVNFELTFTDEVETISFVNASLVDSLIAYEILNAQVLPDFLDDHWLHMLEDPELAHV